MGVMIGARPAMSNDAAADTGGAVTAGFGRWKAARAAEAAR
ncbi:hypothetical protein ABH923_003777 [Leifsonia sp. EB41]